MLWVRKFFHILGCLLLLSPYVRGQDEVVDKSKVLNLVYIHLDYEIPYSQVNLSLDVLWDELKDQKTYVIFVNDRSFNTKGDGFEFPEAKEVDLESLKFKISNNLEYNVEAGYAKSVFLDFFSTHLCEVNENNGEYWVNMLDTYDRVHLYSYVGNSFFENNLHNEVFAKTFKSLGTRDYDADFRIVVRYFSYEDNFSNQADRRLNVMPFGIMFQPMRFVTFERF